MAQVSMTVRMDANVKAQFDRLCQQFGMSANTAVNIFANTVVQEGCIPFLISVNKSKAQDYLLRSFRQFRSMVAATDGPELTLDEINEEIRLARQEMDTRKRAAL